MLNTHSTSLVVEKNSFTAIRKKYEDKNVISLNKIKKGKLLEFFFE
jgi:hypothetical protein